MRDAPALAPGHGCTEQEQLPRPRLHERGSVPPCSPDGPGLALIRDRLRRPPLPQVSLEVPQKATLHNFFVASPKKEKAAKTAPAAGDEPRLSTAAAGGAGLPGRAAAAAAAAAATGLCPICGGCFPLSKLPVHADQCLDNPPPPSPPAAAAAPAAEAPPAGQSDGGAGSERGDGSSRPRPACPFGSQCYRSFPRPGAHLVYYNCAAAPTSVPCGQLRSQRRNVGPT